MKKFMSYPLPSISVSSILIFQKWIKINPLILHAPTNPDFKGTTYIENTLAELRKTHAFDYQRIEKMNHDEVIKLYEKADIIVDQVLCGSYGL